MVPRIVHINSITLQSYRVETTLLSRVIAFTFPNLKNSLSICSSLTFFIWNVLTGKVDPTTSDIASYLANLALSEVSQSHIGLVRIQASGLVYTAS